MKYVFAICLLLIPFIGFPQDFNDANNHPDVVEQKTACFYKDSRKPFSGNLLVDDPAVGLHTKLRIENGFITISEVYDQQNKLVQLQKNNIDVDISSGYQSVFLENDAFLKVDEVDVQTVFLSYKGDAENKRLFEGILEYDNTRLHYKNGIRIKIEYFYDAEFKHIKERYSLFYTLLGNIQYDEITAIYDGDYTIWDQTGKVIENGKYEMGKKIR